MTRDAPPISRPQELPDRLPAPRGYFGELLDPATYRHLLYLGLSLPLALVYFLVLSIGISLGLGLAVLVVGVFILVGSLWTILAFGDLERSLGKSLLGVNLSRRRTLRPEGLWDWVRHSLSDAGTYKATLYLLLKLPYSLLVLGLGGGLITSALGLLATPFWALYRSDIGSTEVQVGSQVYAMTPWSLLALMLLGLGLLVLSVVVLNMLARGWALVSVALLTDYGESVQAQREVQALRRGASAIAPGGLHSSDPVAALAELLRHGVQATAARGALILQSGQVVAEHGLAPWVAPQFAALRPALGLTLEDGRAHLSRQWLPQVDRTPADPSGGEPPQDVSAQGDPASFPHTLGTLVSVPVVLTAASAPGSTEPPEGAEGAEGAAEVHVFFPQGTEPSRRELDFWGTVSDQVAVALETARLLRQARLQGSEQERSRLARELHDSVAQALYGISLGTRAARAQLARDPAKAAENLDYAVQLADGATSEMKALLFALRPDALEEGGLIAALARLAEVLKLRYRLEAPLDAAQEPDLNAGQKGALYRIAQEAAHNAVKHARASRVALSLCGTEAGWQLQIGDDGAGFDPAAPSGGTLGLKSMAERAAGIGAAFSVQTAPGQGTVITVLLPPTAAPVTTFSFSKEPRL